MNIYILYILGIAVVTICIWEMKNVFLDVVQELENVKMVNVVVKRDIVERHLNFVHFL